MAMTAGPSHASSSVGTNVRRGVPGHPKRQADADQAVATSPQRSAKNSRAGARAQRGTKARRGDSFMHGIRQVVERVEKNSRVTGHALPAIPDTQLLEDFEFIVETMNKLGKRFKLARVGAPQRTSTPKATVSANSLPATMASTGPVLGSNDEMISQGQLHDAQTFQAMMGWTTRQALSKAVLSNRVFYLTHRAERYFPAFYGNRAYERTHLEAVSKILGDLPGGSKLQFFLTPKRSLDGQTPLQALAAGRLAKVKDLASAFVEAPMTQG